MTARLQDELDGFLRRLGEDADVAFSLVGQRVQCSVTRDVQGTEYTITGVGDRPEVAFVLARSRHDERFDEVGDKR
jgi:hypothetical protein